ncbi:ATP-binding cassette domain-containing protein [Paenibacillus monticola]|uniref:ATP-binding cassette domain-containing protein n=1 Tax=Paenibacillus monticola TaxID=2666075 RepID=A0A7X2L2N7_9BACL|nr:ABC transporter ATP-binding protein [Paenibacillus monticola]MRN54624.1 ATP-binding cassette domain-containing protein [Paenibacillus monticola]
MSVRVPLIELKQASKLYGGQRVLDEVSMSIEQGTATALIGRNGSGKSTLLSILAGLIHTSSGRLIRQPNVIIGYAPEMFPGLKVTPEQYLRSMGRISGLAAGELEHRIQELLAGFYLEQFRHEIMMNFSKGMLQKINLIQALLVSPALLLLDEPLSGLDLPAIDQLIALLRELQKEGTAIIFSAHEPQMVEALADQVLVLQAGKMIRNIKGTENLWVKPTTYIYCTGLSSSEQMELTDRPGFISLNIIMDADRGEGVGLTVQPEATDDFLRQVLGAGGSIVSVEPQGESGI